MEGFNQLKPAVSRRLAAVAMVALGAAPWWADSTRACMIDGVPSAYANGWRAVVAAAPTTQTYSWWANFAFPGIFRTGSAVNFREDDRLLRPILRAAWWRHPWRWRFSDGKPVVGDSATHTYARQGHYRVYVDALVPGFGYEAFDTISINIRR